MHELSIATAVLNTALKSADGRRVTVVAVSAGRMRQVVPDSLRFYFEIVTRDTELQDARLELTEVPVRLGCGACSQEWEPDWPLFRCPQCGSAEVSVLAGDELSVEYIEVEEREPACTGPR
jgi:hydrogenase nickel incorporation protein HypA/HybF